MAHRTPPHARAGYTAFGEILLTFPYCPVFIEQLKASIPYRYRTYDPTTKAWTVLPEFGDLAIELLVEQFPTLRLHGGLEAAVANRPPTTWDATTSASCICGRPRPSN